MLLENFDNGFPSISNKIFRCLMRFEGFPLHDNSSELPPPSLSNHIAFRSLKSDFQLIKRSAFSTAIKELKLLLQFSKTRCGVREKMQNSVEFIKATKSGSEFKYRFKLDAALPVNVSLRWCYHFSFNLFSFIYFYSFATCFSHRQLRVSSLASCQLNCLSFPENKKLKIEISFLSLARLMTTWKFSIFTSI